MISHNINIFVAKLIVDFLVKHHVKLFCISPGSRSTPLAVAAFDHAWVETKLFYDERAAAYFALSHSRGSGQPAALICTSGTAAANYFPGVIESFQSLLPIAILTADRPDELQNCGANQTIDQSGIFGAFVASSVLFEAPDGNFDPSDMLGRLDASFTEFTRPVHVNCRFREPLAEPVAGFDASSYDRVVENWYSRWPSNSTETPTKKSLVSFDQAVDLINHFKRGLIICGPANPTEHMGPIVALAEHLNWPIVRDVLSSLQSSKNDHVLNLHDLHLDQNDSVRPDIIIHVGLLPTSRRLNQFLLAHRSVPYIKIQNHSRTIDPDRLEALRLVGAVDVTISSLQKNSDKKSKTAWLDLWLKRERATAASLTVYFEKHNCIEAALAFSLPDLLRDGEALFLSNSMPVRDADSFAQISNKDIIVGANRGVSGIDGIIASACGFALGCQRPTTLIVGDLAFLHDMNSLLIAARSNYPIRIIVINNDGGGIFHFLPVAELNEHFEPLFGTPHGMIFENAAAQFGLPYRVTDSVLRFREDFAELCQQGGSFVIEIKSDRTNNHNSHLTIRRMIAKIISELGN